jgi:hypothetical protein
MTPKEYLEQRRKIKAAKAEVPKPLEPALKQAKPPKPEKPLEDMVVYSCGHKIGRKYLEGSLCQGCQRAKRVENIQRKQTEKANNQDTRLPDASSFFCFYDASIKEWTGTLTVSAGGEEASFTHSCSGVMRLFPELDKKYRKWLEGNAK